MWVASEILRNTNIKQRTLTLSKFMELAVALYKLRDYEGFLNIYKGVTKSQVTRLDGTWRVRPLLLLSLH